jgi:hypothetical protein
MKKTYHGSCHCGAVRFECDLYLAVTSKCNCSICSKSRFWKSIAKADEFKLLQGEDTLSEYSFGSGTIHHLFCSHCGVKTFGRGHVEELGDFYDVNIACLDDVTTEEFAQATVIFEDGRNDDWGSAPAETRHL